MTYHVDGMSDRTPRCDCSQTDGCGEISRRSAIKILGATTAAVLGREITLTAGTPTASDTAAGQREKRLAELMDDRRLFARGQRRVYEDERLGAISMCLGGIAAGPIQINGQARRHIWQIAGNYKAISLPHTFFAVRAKAANGPAVVRAVQTASEGPFAAMKSLQFSGEYPFAWYTFTDAALPATIRMECFSPLIPLDEKDSSIPCAIFNLTAENNGQTPVEVSFLATQQNAVGMDAAQAISGRTSPAYGGNVNRVLRDTGATLLHMSTAKPKDSPVYGDMALAVLTKDAPATAAWGNLETLAAQFVGSGDVKGAETAGPTPAGQTVDGALAVPFVLAPGEKRTVSFVLAWHFPNVQQPSLRPGNRYANWWPDALAVARDVAARLGELSAQTHLYNETLYATNLPYWLLDRISSQVAILRSMTCSWARDGFFYAWEGCSPGTGCCPGNATHVWGYAQSHARLFPSVGRAMRDADAGSVQAEGMLPVRFFYSYPAFDGQCAFVMSAYREHLLCADGKWLNSRWPTVKRVMDYAIARWDSPAPSSVVVNISGTPDGMLTGPQHAMDSDQGGTSSWLGSMYLGALAAAARMADIQGDSASAARYREILAAGSKNQDKALFNGEYFIQIPDPIQVPEPTPPRQDYLTGCYIDQLLGQWWALQIDCGWLYPPEHVKSAMAALFKYNFHPDFLDFKQTQRKFCEDSDGGMQQCTWPKGGKPSPANLTPATEEIMSGFEYSAAGLMIYAGLMKEAFTVLRAAADRYDGRLRTGLSPWDFASWGYSGNPFGDDECGKFYARAMAIWSTLLACQGFSYDGPAGLIGFAPPWKPEDHVSFFTAAEGWGLFRQKREGQTQSETIEIKWGRLYVHSLVLEVPSDVKVKDVAIAIADKKAECFFKQDRRRLTIVLPAKPTLKRDEVLAVQLRF
jgi:uncharacterized protein (DUF608 family)